MLAQIILNSDYSESVKETQQLLQSVLQKVILQQSLKKTNNLLSVKGCILATLVGITGLEKQ